MSTLVANLEHAISFGPTGAVAAMHLDSFSLGFLGNQDIARASDIRHNDDTQKWDLWLAVEHCKAADYVLLDEAKGFDTYEGARKIEVQWLQNCRAMGYAPLSDQGKRILTLLRS